MPSPAIDTRREGATSDFAAWVAPHLAVMRRLAAVRAPGVDPDDVV